jgi:transcriptional activator SPT7
MLILCLFLQKVPLRLLQGRMRAAINPAGGEGGPEAAQKDLTEPPPWEPVTLESIEFEIGLIQNFLREKLNKSEESYIIEDENLPIKLRQAKPRLPPTGKISTPRKRKEMPIVGGSAKKKKKSNKSQPPEPPPAQLPTPPMAMIREEDGSDIESLFG